MSRTMMRLYWFEVTALSLGLVAVAAVFPVGEEAVFSVGALTAAALSARRLSGQSLIRA